MNQKKIEQLIKRNYRKGERRLKREVARFYEEYGEDAAEEIRKYKRTERYKKLVRDVSTKVYAANNKAIKSYLKGLVDKSIEETRETMKKERVTGISLDIDVNSIVNSDMSGLNWMERQGFNRELAIRDLQQELIKTVNKGERYEVAAKRLADKWQVDYNRTKRIVRTEGHRCINQAKVEEMKQLEAQGVKLRKKWLAANDERTRSEHAALDGQIVDIDDTFKFNGLEAEGPGMFGEPSMDINCRCTVVMVLDKQG